ncbi:MAG: site-specific integrase [Corynebacterium sp.]|uniref:tyrosine-type recombinase/integrase n=1 Tax=Corynebacterium sp. TaxID=1720 RepID=UPI0026E095F6|nr:site-specific integrase [Corynebacterium sp.]MDO5670839.1 site-specific integrase [Corynebacterium sp.]
MAPRRKRRFGQIDKLPSGKYRARYTGPDGHLHKAAQTYFTRDDAAAWLRSEEKLLEFDEWTPPDSRARHPEDHARTVGDWITKWLDLRTRGTRPLAPSTLQDYQATLDRRILKVTGSAARLRDIPLTALTRRDVAAWWDDINRTFDSPTYNAKAYKRLHTAMQAALDRDIIPANPVNVPEAARRPIPHRKELPETTVMQDIVDQLDRTRPRIDGRHKLVAILTLFHGIRIGEALALRRRDILLTEDFITVQIRGNVYRVPGKGMHCKASAKTAAGWRDVPVFARFHDDVRDHLDRHVGTHPDAWLFTTSTGDLIMDTSYRSIMNRAKERAGHADVRLTPHYGRVWLITTLAEAGMPIPAIGDILGQVDLRTITEIYMRSSKEKRDAVLGQVNQALDGTAPGVADLDARRAEKEDEESA